MKNYFAMMAAVVTLGVAWDAGAGRTTIDLKAADVSVRDSQEPAHGDYVLLDVKMPEGLTTAMLLGAILEFYVDVDSRPDTVTVTEQDSSYAVVQWNPTPLIEIYALSSSSGSALDSERWNQEMAFPVPIGVGEGKIVRVDITRLVKHLLAHPEQNNGVVIGSLTGRREGRFTLRESFGPGVYARIRYVY